MKGNLRIMQGIWGLLHIANQGSCANSKMLQLSFNTPEFLALWVPTNQRLAPRFGQLLILANLIKVSKNLKTNFAWIPQNEKIKGEKNIHIWHVLSGTYKINGVAYKEISTISIIVAHATIQNCIHQIFVVVSKVELNLQLTLIRDPGQSRI